MFLWESVIKHYPHSSESMVFRTN